MSLVTLHNDELTVKISSVGAEIQSVVDKNGVERIWCGDPAVWASHAPVLFPVAGAFRDDYYELDGQRYPMNKHGFVRPATWQVESAEENRAVFLIQQKHEGFPFEYDLRAQFALKDNRIEVTYACTSRDDRPFYFSVGAHEAYATPEGIEEYEIVFDQEERLEASGLAGTLISHDTTLLAEKSKTLPLKYDYFAVDALVFLHIQSKGVTLRGGKDGRTVRVDFPDHPVLLLWTKPGARYICIEPWCNAPDFTDADHRIDHKPGFMRLEKGQTIERTHTITFN